MGSDPHSPLPEEERAGFQGLKYFPFNEDLFLELPLDRNVSHDTITMETSTGDQNQYTRAGKVHFEVDGQPVELSIYAAEDGEFFLPLRDATSGKETYGAGRYVEPEAIDEENILVDLNLLYNPYCAYDERYSCPLPPRENWLQVPIRAGETTYKE